MAENTEIVRSPIYSEDMGWGDSATPTTVDILDDTGEEVSYTATPIDSALIPLSTAAKTTLGLSGDKDLDDAWVALSVGVATTAARGTVKISTAAADPVALITDDDRVGYIPSTTEKDGLGVNTGADAASSINGYVTKSQLLRHLFPFLGTGKDGHFYLGAVAASSTAPTVSDVTQSGTLTGTYTWKIAAFNYSGSIVASSASTSSGAIVSKKAVLTFPALPSLATGWYVYRSSDGANWYFVGRAVLGANYFETGTDANKYTDDCTYPNTGKSAPGSDTTGTSGTLSAGRYDFLTFTGASGQTINVPATGNCAGFLDIRVQGTATRPAGFTITGVGSNAVSIGHLAPFTGTATAQIGWLVGINGINTSNTFSITQTTSFSNNFVALGWGADASKIWKNHAGFGHKGATGSSTGGDGNWGGPHIRFWTYQFTDNIVSDTITATGGTGVAGTGTGAQGGSAGAGGIIDEGAYIPYKDAGTKNANGGTGGAASGSGGANTAYGGGAGGGGAVVRRNCYDKASATTSVAGGSHGANNTSATTAATGASFGAGHFGNGGRNGATPAAAAAGQQFDFNDYSDPSSVFAA